MQIHSTRGDVGDGELPVRLNPGDTHIDPFAIVEIGFAKIYLQSPEDCHRLIAAAVNAEQLLLSVPLHCEHDDAGLPWNGAHAFIQCTGCSEDRCNACSRPAGDELHQPVTPDPDACKCGHLGGEHIFRGESPCTQCECKAFTAAPSGGVMFGPFSPQDGATDDKPAAPAAIVRPSAVCGAKNPAARGDCTRHRGHKGGHTNTAAGTYWRDVTEASRA
jgi:hypothetical protein